MLASFWSGRLKVHLQGYDSTRWTAWYLLTLLGQKKSKALSGGAIPGSEFAFVFEFQSAMKNGN